MYEIETIASIIQGKLSGNHRVPVAHLAYDSRKLPQPESTLFFALVTPHADGHHYVNDAYKKGVRAFVVNKEMALNNAAVIVVPDTLKALQMLAAHHRKSFHFPVIGITGSNGKTVVKEWLAQLLEAHFKIVRSPKSFNSQIGVPLSVWNMEPQHTLGIFEAGISQRGEMLALQNIIQPTIGVLTNIGEAHSEGFLSDEEKLKEKLVLFKNADIIIGPHALLDGVPQQTFTWGYNTQATLQLQPFETGGSQTIIKAVYQQQERQLTVPFTDEASLQNLIACWCVMLYLNIPQPTIEQGISGLHAVDMRLQLRHVINNCLLINDSYSADTTSLKIALQFFEQQSAALKRTVILSDFFESSKPSPVLYQEIAQLLLHYKVGKLIVIGEHITAQLTAAMIPGIGLQPYSDTEKFIRSFRTSAFHNEIILLKGARKFGFENIALLFEEKVHGTVLQINLAALAHNLKQYQNLLPPATKIMAMVKAFSYGSGSAEIASVLQFYNVAYLGVAYADEGVELVKAGITVPIMVMNPEPTSFAAVVDNNLQPVLYTDALLQQFTGYIKQQGLTTYPVHLEIETGMNRLGFALELVPAVAQQLSATNDLVVQSVFTHLAASEEAAQDGFTKLQAERFQTAVSGLKQFIHYPFLQHISNSAAIVRHPELALDMVRLGIGMYGVQAHNDALIDLQTVATLRTTVAQIKKVKKGESVGYNRRGVVQRDSLIATVRIGYADGYSRRFGNGVGKMLLHKKTAPVIGTVCMDMTMIDVTDIDGVKEGDDVIVFGAEWPVQTVATLIGTIPYEIMTSVSQRVKRVYYFE